MSGLVPNPSVLLPLVVIDGTNELVTSTPIVTDFVGVEEVEVVPMINKSSSNHGFIKTINTPRFSYGFRN